MDRSNLDDYRSPRLFYLDKLMNKVTRIAFKQQRKSDALELAKLVYDIYKEQQLSGKIISGQNNAQLSEIK